jgi:antitoxin VapB
MAILNIKDPAGHKLAKKLSNMTGKNLTKVIIEALEEKLERTMSVTREDPARLFDEPYAMTEKTAAFPVIDKRSPDEILGYDDRGYRESN